MTNQDVMIKQPEEEACEYCKSKWVIIAVTPYRKTKALYCPICGVRRGMENYEMSTTN